MVVLVVFGVGGGFGGGEEPGRAGVLLLQEGLLNSPRPIGGIGPLGRAAKGRSLLLFGVTRCVGLKGNSLCGCVSLSV